MRDPRYDVLFEPVRIGPKVARNRFFQVPHCNGMGHRHPTSLAAMRGIKAEGGWAVVCTEEVEIHHTSGARRRRWRAGCGTTPTCPAHRRIVDADPRHGSLAGIELVHSGLNASNSYPRVAAIGPSARPLTSGVPRAGAGDDARRHRRAARVAPCRRPSFARRRLRPRLRLRRARAHRLPAVPQPPLQRPHRRLRRLARRTGRGCCARWWRTPSNCAPAGPPSPCGCASTSSSATTASSAPRSRSCSALIGELPDLWDFMVGEWDFDSSTSRFEQEGYSEPWVRRPEGAHHQARGRRRPVHLARHHGAAWCAAASPTSSAPPGRRSPTRSCRTRSRRAGWRTSASASAATSASPPTGWSCPSDARRTRRWARSGGAAGTPSASGPKESRRQGAGGRRRARPGWRPRCGWAGAATRWCSPRRPGSSAAGWRSKPDCPAWPSGAGWPTTACCSSQQLDNVLVTLESPMTADEIVEYDFTHVAVATGARWRDDGLGIWHHTAGVHRRASPSTTCSPGGAPTASG